MVVIFGNLSNYINSSWIRTYLSEATSCHTAYYDLCRGIWSGCNRYK
jgi:hypothetical protein